MEQIKKISLLLIIVLAVTSCNLFTFDSPTEQSHPTDTPTIITSIPIIPNEENPNEPIVITGDIPYTSPFFVSTLSQPFVLLEDEAGYVERNLDFVFSLEGQVLGPVIIHEDDTLTYHLSLPTIPQGTFVDVDRDNKDDKGVQVFAVAYWSNTWDGPFLEGRDGTGWSTSYSSTKTDAEDNGEIIGGKLIVWAPDDKQGFPSGFGDDGNLFTADDPITSIPAGYSIVDLSENPFKIYKESTPNITLIEGDIAVNDYSDLTYTEAFNKLFEKVSKEYPFTQEKNIDWQALYNKYAPQIKKVDNDQDFFRIMHNFTFEIPDGHVYISINPDVFYEEKGGGFGLVLSQLSDGRVIVRDVINDSPAQQNGIKKGAEIISWNNEPVQKAIDKITPYFGPYSTKHVYKLKQIDFLTRVPPGTNVELSYKNPGDITATTITLNSEVEYQSIFETIPSFNTDPLSLPVESYTLNDETIGYIRVSTFSDDYHLMAQLWERSIKTLLDEDISSLIIDIRNNSGGSTGLALDFAGFFFDKEFVVYQSAYYNEKTGKFEYVKYKPKVHPSPYQFEGDIAVLIGPNCISACEGFAYALSQYKYATIIGHSPSAGAFGEVGRGQ